jgi:hypothetical protein
MKPLSFFSLPVTALAVLAIVPFGAATLEDAEKRKEASKSKFKFKKPTVGQIAELALLANYLKGSPAPDPSLPPQVQAKTARYWVKEHNAKRIKVRYGPYRTRSVNSNGIEKFFLNEPGMSDTGEWNAMKPCSSCMITYMKADLEYANGTLANIDSGMWLHHMVFNNNGPGRHDNVCPGMDERFFSSGNEHSPTDMTNNGTLKNGYIVKPTDRFWMMLELMNMNPEEREVYLTMDYEFVPGIPQEFKPVKAMWFDISNCGPSFIPARDTKIFEYPMNPWNATFNATPIGVGGHLHDGGTKVEVYRNGEIVCTPEAFYDDLPEYRQASGSMGGLKHITRVSQCYNFAPIEVGDQWWIKAYYNLTEHPAMKSTDGKLDPVMGISILYASVP